MFDVNKANSYIDSNKKRVKKIYRQHIHLQPPIGWMNDPNGFIFFNNEFHVFYQYYPYDSKWGPMHWGHAVSVDGMFWKNLPVALAPDSEYDNLGCFSGSSIIKENKMYLFYTGGMEEDGVKKQQQCLSTSIDFIHYDKYIENPIVSADVDNGISETDFRDPKVIYRHGLYYMFVVTKENNRGKLVLYTSDDLKVWEFKSVVLTLDSTYGEMIECPDIIEFESSDVLILSTINMAKKDYKFSNKCSSLYFVGKMDWNKGQFSYHYFDEIDAGLDFYAPQVTTNDKGEVLMIAWMQMWDRSIPTHELNHGWAGCMTVLRKLSIEGNKLLQLPYIFEKNNVFSVENIEEYSFVVDRKSYILHIDYEQLADFEVKLYNGNEQIVFTKNQSNYNIDRSALKVKIDGLEEHFTNSRKWKDDNSIKCSNVDIIFDNSSLEVFIGKGEKTMSMRFFSESPLDKLCIKSSTSDKKIKKIRCNNL
ncbi:glycoside hydrolase family 32 protein [Vagococcus bubulae]|uniref:beta-fructofuranosidase n=1 Tax=Vagococcus bubulae TaxID=1977868 RepID=A0A429ZFH4_9ENTE|nr:GH32 C-terminal domain-containing protein [Vagococcus bubulae]RST92430.1 hypothetical protein CBF36_08655 [Vagococcus bubulae]